MAGRNCKRVNTMKLSLVVNGTVCACLSTAGRAADIKGVENGPDLEIRFDIICK
jgi:hypothetical protein